MDQLIKPGVTKKISHKQSKTREGNELHWAKIRAILPQGCEVLRRTTKLHQSSELNQVNKK